MLWVAAFICSKFFYTLFESCSILQDAIKIDDDLLVNSERSLETLVSVGMTLGVSTKKPAGAGLPNLESCVLGDWVLDLFAVTLQIFVTFDGNNSTFITVTGCWLRISMLGFGRKTGGSDSVVYNLPKYIVIYIWYHPMIPQKYF